MILEIHHLDRIYSVLQAQASYWCCWKVPTRSERGPADYDILRMLDIAHISRMSQWDCLPPGSKRRSDFTDPERPGSYRFPPSQQSHTSQSSEASTSPQSSRGGQRPNAVGQLPSLTARIGISSDVVGTQTDASFHASSSKMRLPTPLPVSPATFVLPPMALSSPRPASYTPHSGSVPHNIGTDYLNMQTLQRENMDLASAYAQAEIYIADLDTKLQASHAENGKLAKERQRLAGKVELLEAQLEELEQSIQQIQEHTAAKDAQYLRIVEFSTRLQTQESQARKAEQQEWSSEKRSMQSVIDSLKNEVKGLRKTYASYAKSTKVTTSRFDDYPEGIDGKPDLTAESLSHGLFPEMEALRRANAKMKDALAGVRGDNAQLTEYIGKLGSVEQNIQMHLQRMETARGTLDALGGGDGAWAAAKEQRLMAKE